MSIHTNPLGGLPCYTGGRSRAITAENPTGEKGGGGHAASGLGAGRKGSPCIPQLDSGETKILADIRGIGVIEHIWITVTDKTSGQNAFVLRDLVLRMYWNGEAAPSVECPLGDFFCCGFGQSYLVNSMPIVVNPTRGFNCYFPMPFGGRARITIENQNEEPVCGFFYQIDYCLYDALPENACYFHAQWRRQPLTEKARDYVVLDGVKGQGQYVGTFLALSTLERYWWGEGEMKFYLDGDTDYPTICGTGTEDYFGGAWSFADQQNGRTTENTYNSLYQGYPFHSTADDRVHNDYHMDDCPPMRAFYRFHIADPIYFAQDLRVTLQQLGSWNRGLFERQDDVATVAYWYQTLPQAAFPALPPRMARWPR